MTTAARRLGDWGEALAARYLEGRGYRVLARNARTPYGEIDLVAAQDAAPGEAVTVFVEVKTRRSAAFGLPEEAVTASKKAHLLAAAQAYLQENPAQDGCWRIDVIAIRVVPGEPNPQIAHFENAVS